MYYILPIIYLIYYIYIFCFFVCYIPQSLSYSRTCCVCSFWPNGRTQHALARTQRRRLTDLEPASYFGLNIRHPLVEVAVPSPLYTCIHKCIQDIYIYLYIPRSLSYRLMTVHIHSDLIVPLSPHSDI